MISISILFDKISDITKLATTGSSVVLDKFIFSSSELCFKFGLIVEDRKRCFKRDVERVMRITRANARRKELGTDLIEVVFNQQGRIVDGRELRPMHL